MPLLLQGWEATRQSSTGVVPSQDDIVKRPATARYPTAGFDEFALAKSRVKIPVKFKRSR
jgi:hypothetical protein